MNPPETNDPLDALLREQDKYIEDNGFTARVIATLPRRRRRAWLRPAILLGATAIGSVLAVWWLPWGNLPVLDSSALFSLNSQVLMPWVLVLSVVASLAWGTVSALQWED
ncbi:MAG: hypothetical protein ABSE97_01150 [Verrucomicrobiota bacterium]|jgi:hypothetical protein